MGTMTFHSTPLKGLTVVETSPVTDERGSFVRTYCEDDFAHIRPGLRWTQSNLSSTVNVGTVRGMHYQRPPAAEVKLIRCLKGRVFDVAIDVRAGSPTFLEWHAVELNSDNQRMMLIPEGFAHGFQALTDDVQLLYMHSHSWAPEYESRLRFDDPRAGIVWPLLATHVSDKDLNAPWVDEHFSGVDL
jgi:dTDP-4-dehydrorhamnose 3,5-epimerase